ncbi:hypothetical protein F5X99DRAFT_169323 [Biscogniauxia marginata]|nr:hypothetical protein F5X99DRAFT_169323 [Biscogniauxia marginata]
MSSSSKKLADFPDVEAKLQKPSKQSAFEKQKADVEAKRKREAEETAAVYETFVKSFDHDGDDGGDGDSHGPRGRQQGAPFGRPGGNAAFGGGGPAKRHFGAPPGGSAMKSGPGSLGPAPTAFGKKKFDNYQQPFNRRGPDEARGRLGYHDDDGDGSVVHKPKGIPRAFDTSDDEADARARDIAEEKAIARPTLRLANLPPGTSPAVIKALMPENLNVENVKILPSANTGGSERKSMAAIVTLSQETPATDLDGAVSSLQNRYLGYGFYLSLHRHLSSAVASTTVTSSLTSSSTSHAFGAKPVPQGNDSNSYRPGGFHRGFAPPSSYDPAGTGPMQRSILYVPVQAPRDIKQIQLIHKVVESVLEHGPEFEALLMSRPDVQRDEKWAWLWDARSEGGVWYRWRLWEVITGTQANPGRQGKYLPLFEGSHAWKTPEKPLVYEYATAIDEFVSDSEYNSSDEEDYEDEGNKQTEGADTEKTYLNPLDKARLTHLLARLPTTLGRIRKGDVARVTTFAITHSSRGADEIVDMIVTNIVKPFALTSANPEYKKNGDDGEPARVSQDSTPLPEDVVAKSTEAQDTSGSSLVGLYIVSDILSSSATSGVRHAWRYRQLFETALKQSKVFETLGLTAERLNWGRLRAEKWKRSVGLVLSLWEGWCAFPNESQQLFTHTFENPPSAKKEEQVEEEPRKTNKWKPVEAGPGAQAEQKGFLPISASVETGYNNEEVGNTGSDVDGDVIDEDMLDVDLDSDIDGVPMDEDDDGEPMDQDPTDTEHEENKDDGDDVGMTGESESGALPSKELQKPRRRMRAVDMFADSDASDDGK